ncbi:MAG: hypothetical protein WA117_14985 [Verrucomicrobiia bacterium]
MSLKPPDTVFRFLFTSSAWFVGESSGDSFWLTPAFPAFDRRNRIIQYPAGPYRHSHFTLSILVPEPDRTKKVVPYPVYEWVGEEVSALLGAFYGKLILNLGHTQAGRLLTVPVSFDAAISNYAKPPFNDSPRRPKGTDLNLQNAGALLDAYIRSENDTQLTFILRASEFYRIALENYGDKPEIAFTMLVSALEALLDIRTYTENELYHESLLNDLKQIQETCPNGVAIVNRLKARFFQIKRKIAALVSEYVPDSFFTERETSLGFGFIKDRPELIERVRAAYDLRSRLLHTGDRTGLWFVEFDHQGSEIGLGEPVLRDKELVKLLRQGVALTGMERIVSTVLRTVIERWITTVSKPKAVV